jgi:ketosteroid isomerase-like protein
MTRFVLPACCLLAACAGTPPAMSTRDIAPLVQAELAFGARTAAHGWNAGVRSFAAPRAVVANPLPVDAFESLEPAGDVNTGSPLQWRPAFSGMALSRDIGFTTGPWFLKDKGYGGHYFTVWRRTATGEWKWLYDGGVRVGDAAPQPADAPIERLAPAKRGVGESHALEDVRTLESALAATGTRDALASRLAANVHLNRASQPRATDAAAARRVLAREAATVRYEPQAAFASRAGDLVFTHGIARWQDGQERSGSYARIWQRQDGGWRIVYDQIVPPR